MKLLAAYSSEPPNYATPQKKLPEHQLIKPNRTQSRLLPITNTGSDSRGLIVVAMKPGWPAGSRDRSESTRKYRKLWKLGSRAL